MTSKPNAKQLEMEIEKIYKDLTRKKPTRDQVIKHLERMAKQFEEVKIVLTPPVR